MHQIYLKQQPNFYIRKLNLKIYFIVIKININPLMPGGNKNGDTYLNKPAAESCRFV